MLADPRRSLSVRTQLHLGQTVRFVDFRDGQMRSGKIIAFRDTQAFVLEQGTKRTWKIPCRLSERLQAWMTLRSRLSSPIDGQPWRSGKLQSRNAVWPASVDAPSGLGPGRK